MMERLCLVEDDPTIRELVAKRLRKQGYDVTSFDNAESVGSEEWDLYILDVLLKGATTGLELCTNLREERPTVPILIVSALSDPADRIEGLKNGADDYITKPFEMEELLLRVEGMLKRRGWYQELPEDRTHFEWADNAIDFQKFEGRRGRDTFSLSQKECMLMKLLIEKRGEVVKREEILNRVWGYDVFPSTRTVDNFILRLRKHFEPDPKNPKYLHSVRGVGYKLTPGKEL